MKKINFGKLSKFINFSKSEKKRNDNSLDQVKKKGSFLNRFQSVGMKLFLTFLISIVAFVSVVGFLAYQTSKDIIEEKVSLASHQTIIVAKEKLDMIYSQYEQISTQFYVDKDFQNLVTEFRDAETGSIERLQLSYTLSEALQKSLFADDLLQNIHLYQEDGSYMYTTDSVYNGIDNVAGTDWFKNTIEKDGEPYWIEPQTEPTFSSNKQTFTLARVIRNSDFTTAAVLLLEIKLHALSQQLEKIHLGDSDEKLIVNEEGDIIYSSEGEEIGKEADIQFSSNTSDSLVGENENGQETLVVYDQSENHTGWYVAGTVPVSELIEDTKRISQITIIMALLAALLAILIGYILARKFGNPLVQLRNLMQKGEQGDLTVRANIRNKDEIGQLGESFNKMMAQITVLVQQTNHSAQEVLSTASELSNVSKKTSVSAREISVATEQIAEGSSTLAVEAERGNELTQNIMVEMNNVVESNMEMGKSANEVRKISEQGIEYMTELINKTNLTEQMTRSMTEKVDNLKASTSSIRQILDVLNSVSKQTNILSLNATIEAARAGAAGKGFMVVADEIRKLAEQSRESIDVVGQITEGIQNEVEETVNALSEAYPIFKEQTDSVREADLIFKNVQEQMGDFIKHLDTVTNSIQQLEQSQTVLSEAMSSVSSVSQESSATSEEVASLTAEQLSVSDGLVQLSEKLETLSHTLKELLSKFNT